MSSNVAANVAANAVTNVRNTMKSSGNAALSSAKSMATNNKKKCLANTGLCLTNMAWFLLGILVVSVGFLYVKVFGSTTSTTTSSNVNPQSIDLLSNSLNGIGGGSSIGNSSGGSLNPDINDPYSPPLKHPSAHQLPPPIATQSRDPSYQQIGILTKDTGNADAPTILPLMGRALSTARDKWQYYTMTNTPGAAISSRLPVNSNGKTCTGEYGCDGVSNGDSLFVDGYNDTFKAIVYETGGYEYRPTL